MATGDKLVNLDSLKIAYDTSAKFTAPTEASSTASAAHATGEHFIYNGVLYVATTDIASGATITPNTNCRAVPGGIGGEVSELKSAIEAQIGNVEYTIIDDKYIVYNTGAEAASTAYKATGYIPFDGFELSVRTRVENGYCGIAFYNASKTYISGYNPYTDNGAYKKLTKPANAYYVRISCLAGSISELSVLYNSITDTIKDNVDNIADMTPAVENIIDLSKKTTEVLNYAPAGEKTETVLNVLTSYADGELTLSGTANGNGGRLIPVSPKFYLSAGKYTLAIENNTIATAVIQNGSTLLAQASLSNTPVTFTLDDDSADIFLSITVASGTAYSGKIKYYIVSGEEINAYGFFAGGTASAIDKDARGALECLNFAPIGEKSITVLGVAVGYNNGIAELSNTATGNGGRTTPISPLFSLEAGTYTVRTQSIQDVTTFVEQGDTIIAHIVHPGDIVQFTLPQKQTGLFLSVNLVSGTAYDTTINFQIVKGQNIKKAPFVEGKTNTAVDLVARYNANEANNHAYLLSSFIKIGVVGDSLASGECCSNNTVDTNHDLYEHSWLQYMARRYGFTGVNFSKGGLSTTTWLTDSEGLAKAQVSANKCNCYMIGLGTNDLKFQESTHLGTTADIGTEADTVYGNYSRIIQELKTIQPKAVFFLFTLTWVYTDTPSLKAYSADINTAIRYIANLYDNCYLVDLEDDMFFYSDDVKDNIRSGHFNAISYNMMAEHIARIIGKYIYENQDEFRQIEFIGTDWAWNT
jgi:hypothetical protein